MDATDHDEIPVPGELDAEDESPFLRRQRAVAVRRRRFSQRWRWILFTVFVLVPLGLAGYLLAVFALTSPRFSLRSAEDVAVNGAHFVPREEILNALGVSGRGASSGGMHIFRISLEEKRRQVESLPWVHSATVTRSYPHRLVVDVVERTPMAFVNMGGSVKLVDSEGVVLERPETASFDFPVLTGLDVAGTIAERRSRLSLYERFVREVAEEIARSGWLVSEIDLSDGDDLKALLVQGRETVQVHFGYEDFLERFRTFISLLPEVRKANPKIDSIDLRYRNQVVVNPQAAAPERAETPLPPAAQKD